MSDVSPRTRARALLARATPRRIRLEERGVEIALLELGGEGPLALLHHANGFCKGTLALLAERLTPRFRVVAMDARGHGDSSRPEDAEAFRWDAFAEDLLGVASQLAQTQPDGRVALALGHSFGGTSTLGAAARRPGLFGRLVLVDPVVPPPDPVPTPERRRHVQALADGARRRRQRFPSREKAFAAWRRHPFFARWREEALWLYVEDGLREVQDGVALKCPGEVEAAVFEHGAGLDVAALARAAAPVPCLWLWAAQGSFPLPRYRELAASMRHARVEPVQAGHLAPMEQPERVAEAVLRFTEEDPS